METPLVEQQDIDIVMDQMDEHRVLSVLLQILLVVEVHLLPHHHR